MINKDHLPIRVPPRRPSLVYDEGKREGAREERERIIEWGDEPCPHFPTIKMKKHTCPECWQALTREGK